MLFGRSALFASILLARHLHRGFEAADAVSYSFAELGKLFGSEDEQSDPENYQQMHGLKQSFKHNFSLGIVLRVLQTD